MAGILDFMDASPDSLFGMLNLPASQGFGDVPKDKNADAKAMWAKIQADTDQQNADADRRNAAGLAASSAIAPTAPVAGAGLPAIDPAMAVKMAMGQSPGTPFGALSPPPATPAPVTPPPVAQASVPMPTPRPAIAPPAPIDDTTTPAAATPTQGQLPTQQQPTTPPKPGFLDGLNNYIDTHRGQLMAMAGGLAGAPSLGQGIGRGFTAAAAALPADQKMLMQQGAFGPVVTALMKAGVPHDLAVASYYNPTLLKSVTDSYIGDRKGEVVKTKDALGAEHVQVFDPYTKKLTNPDGGTAADGGTVGGPGILAPGVKSFDSTLTGDSYLQQFSPEVQAATKSWLNGDVMPTGNPRQNGIANFAKTVGQKYAQDMGIPAGDALYAEKRKMKTDLGSSGNSSMGGILSNGQSAFSHLAELGDSMSGLGNASHDFPGGGAAANVQNYVGNVLTPSSATKAQIKAINDNLGHYGQESTKFYSGTGGGIEERMNALKEMNPATTSSEEMAAYLEKEKSLMMDRMNTKFGQIKQSLGEKEGNIEIAKKLPDLQANLGRIDANIARLRGTAPQAAATAAPAAQPVTATGPNGHKIALQNGRWIDTQTGQPVQ